MKGKRAAYFFDTITSKTYWQYILLSGVGVKSVLFYFGAIYLIIETLDFFRILNRDQYPSYCLYLVLVMSILISAWNSRPIETITIRLQKHDFCVEIKIADLFDVGGAVMISTNTEFEMDVAGGKIAPDSLQGQFVLRYYLGNQTEFIDRINEELRKIGSSPPYPLGTTVPVTTHGKTFYFTAMAALTEKGNAESTIYDIRKALDGLWRYVGEAGELQELVVPVVGTGRGRIQITRKKMIALIAESFVNTSEQYKFTDKLVIVIRPEDASNFGVNLYDIKDNLNHLLL